VKIKYGLIGEDSGHIDCLTAIIKKLRQKNSISYDKFIGRGCGKVKRKAQKWIELLRKKNCNRLILIRDLDQDNYHELLRELQGVVENSSITIKFICIPIEEIEAWIISDLEAVFSFFQIKKAVKEFSNPEKIRSPKEEIARIVKKETNGAKMYLHTRHNQGLIDLTSIEKMRKCPQFKKLEEFIVNN
jgi:ribosomal protein L29